MTQQPKRWLPEALLTPAQLRRLDAVYDADDLGDGEEPAQWGTFEGASDEKICRESDMGHPVASEIFESWPIARQRAAARKVDAEDRKH